VTRWVSVGRVGRPHGLDGSFVVEAPSDDPERLAAGARVYVAHEPAIVVASKRAGGRPVIKLDRPLKQSTIILGNQSLTRKHPDFYAARVMNYILGGGGFESRLMTNLREEKGLVYSVYSYFDAGIHAGHWRLILQTKNESANQAIQESIAEVRRMQESGATEKELQEAKDYITGSFATRLASSSQIAEYILSVEQLGFPPDYADLYLGKIRAVAREQIQEAARKYIRLEEAVLAAVGNLAEADLKY